MNQIQRSVLIIAHGSDAGTGIGAAEIHARRVETLLGVRTRHVTKDCDAETMRRTLSYLSLGDVEEIVVIPLFFASGPFSESLVPRMLGLEEGARAGTVQVDGRRVRVRIGRPFGTDPLMRGVIGSVMARNDAAEGRTAVMLIGHGSKDGRNAAAVEYNAGIVREFGMDAFPCYNEMIDPGVEETLGRVLSEGYEDILAIPLFVSTSRHSAVEIPQKLGLEGEARERHIERDGRQVRLRYNTEIGLEPGISDIICNMVEHRSGHRERGMGTGRMARIPGGRRSSAWPSFLSSSSILALMALAPMINPITPVENATGTDLPP